MTTLRDVLRAGDPAGIHDEAVTDRRAVIRAAALEAYRTPAGPAPGRRQVVGRVAAVTAATAVASVGLVRLWPWLEGPALAAVRFEVRLAEVEPAPGLREAPVGSQPLLVYLHDDAVVTNDHLLFVQVVPVGERFGLSVRLSAEGARRLREATRTHVGRPLALMVDGLVVMAPTVRSEIGEVGVVSGGFDRDAAERLARGMLPR